MQEGIHHVCFRTNVTDMSIQVHTLVPPLVSSFVLKVFFIATRQVSLPGIAQKILCEIRL